jgi:transcriptional regulator with XRE-family HTH domain
MVLTSEQLTYLKTIPNEQGNRVRAARKFVEVTQSQLAEAVGSTQAYISYLERDPFTNVAVDLAHRLKDFFGCAIEDLFPARDEKASAA